MHNNLIQDLASILICGALFAWFIKKFLKLPMIIGYVCAGILLKLPIAYTPEVLDPPMVQNLSEVGVLMLLFSMGLHFGFRKIKSLGFSTLFVAVAQVLCMWFSARTALLYLGLPNAQALFLGAAVCCSATSVILKTIDDFQLKTHRFAEKLMGTLLVEDCVALFILIFLTTLSQGQVGIAVSFWQVGLLFLGSLLLWWVLGTILLPRWVRMAFDTGKDELLSVLCVGLALGLAYLSGHWGFSPAIGAFMMGSILSECRELKKIELLIEPIKNIFALVFFVSIGLLFSPHVFLENYKIIIVLVCIIIFGKFIFNTLLNIIVGRGLQDSLMMGGSMGQIGELSFVIAQVGLTLNLVNETLFSSIVAVSVITMILTPFQLKISSYAANNSVRMLPKCVLTWLENYQRLFYFVPSKRKIFKGWIFNIVSILFKKLHKKYVKVTSSNVSNTLNRLAPWDEYLVPVPVAMGSQLVGKTLSQLKLREERSLNVVAIERDMYVEISPKASTVIMGGDTLLVYGEESEIMALEHLCQTQREQKTGQTIDDCVLARVILTSKHKFVGHSILELRLREKHSCTVLAINRNNERIKNPLSSFMFEEGDMVFVFGARDSLSHF